MGDHDRQQRSAGAGEPASSTLESVTAAWEQTTRALRESERRYRELVEYSLGLICTHDLSGTILSINPAAANSLEYHPSDGTGRNLREFLAPDKQHLFDDYLQRIQAEGQDAGLMRVVARSGAEKVWIYHNVLSHGPDGPYVLGHASDITERVAAERTLRLSEQALRATHAELEERVKERTVALERANEQLRLEIARREEAQHSNQRALIRQRDTLTFLASVSERLAPLISFEHLIDVVRRLPVPLLADWTMVHVVHDNGIVRFVAGVHVDPALEQVLGSMEVAPCRLEDLTKSMDTFSVLTLNGAEVVRRLADLGLSPEILERLGAGTAAMLPMSVGGRLKGILSLVSAREHRLTSADSLVVDDAARRIRLAFERVQLYREAEEANRLKDEFLSTLSHELRTPLNAIFGWARILRGRNLDASTAHAVEVIERNAEAQVRLIEDVLDVSRIVKGKMTLELAPLDLAAVVRATIDTVRPAIHAKRIVLEEQLAPIPQVLGDSHRLQQVFWNLLTNAIKFTGSDGTIAVALRSVGDTVEFEIVDTGIGIRREVLPFVFDRFRQADSSTTRTYGGLGLGLAIVRHIIELHGGMVRAASAGEGHGATFTIQLATAEHGASEPQLRRRSPDPAVRSRLGDRRILVVDDHDDAREMIAGVLEEAGARVLFAASTAEAIDCARRERPDVLVTDIGLPDQDGYALLAQLRALYPQLPAVALTAYARSTDRERAAAAGFQQHVIKPVDPNELVRLIVSVLGNVDGISRI